jgi:hypothetical protein
MVITVDIVLKVYASVLDGSITYSNADRWAWGIIELFDNENLTFEPREKEKIIWELIQYLYGIDMTSMEDRTRMMISNLDIIDFLKEKNVYGLLP